MPIKNYTTKVGADQSIREIQKCLIEHGVNAVAFAFEQGTGRVEALQFSIELSGQKINFKLPVEWRLFQAVLKEQGVSRANDETFCYRVAWRVIRDWVLAQMALYETQMVTIPQIFLPYAVTRNGNTLFDEVAQNPQLLLE